jgi:hypothetical protein
LALGTIKNLFYRIHFFTLKKEYSGIQSGGTAVIAVNKNMKTFLE